MYLTIAKYNYLKPTVSIVRKYLILDYKMESWCLKDQFKFQHTGIQHRQQHSFIQHRIHGSLEEKDIMYANDFSTIREWPTTSFLSDLIAATIMFCMLFSLAIFFTFIFLIQRYGDIEFCPIKSENKEYNTM